jgi:hypothetical protein
MVGVTKWRNGVGGFVLPRHFWFSFPESTRSPINFAHHDIDLIRIASNYSILAAGCTLSAPFAREEILSENAMALVR